MRVLKFKQVGACRRSSPLFVGPTWMTSAQTGRRREWRALSAECFCCSCCCCCCFCAVKGGELRETACVRFCAAYFAWPTAASAPREPLSLPSNSHTKLADRRLYAHSGSLRRQQPRQRRLKARASKRKSGSLERGLI